MPDTSRAPSASPFFTHLVGCLVVVAACLITAAYGQSITMHATITDAHSLGGANVAFVYALVLLFVFFYFVLASIAIILFFWGKAVYVNCFQVRKAMIVHQTMFLGNMTLGNKDFLPHRSYRDGSCRRTSSPHAAPGATLVLFRVIK